MGGDKDLIIHEGGGGDRKSPLVTLLSEHDERVYREIGRLKRQMKAIKDILEGKTT